VADEHRRVEPNSIVGTGMRTDPEHIREVAEERERVLRQRREKPKKGFGDVLQDAPARNVEEPGEPDEALEAEAVEEDAPAGNAPAPIDLDEPEPDLPKVPPDPRMRALHAALEKKTK
jgi:hypothetical protein